MPSDRVEELRKRVIEWGVYGQGEIGRADLTKTVDALIAAARAEGAAAEREKMLSGGTVPEESCAPDPIDDLLEGSDVSSLRIAIITGKILNGPELHGELMAEVVDVYTEGVRAAERERLLLGMAAWHANQVRHIEAQEPRPNTAKAFDPGKKYAHLVSQTECERRAADGGGDE